jgi:hypothetical protein
MKLTIQCDSAMYSGKDTIWVSLPKMEAAKVRAFVREHGELHTIIST